MITGAQLFKDFPAVGERRLEVVNALLREHSLYPVDVSPLLFDQAIATRYDKTARNFLAAIHLSAAIVWLN